MPVLSASCRSVDHSGLVVIITVHARARAEGCAGGDAAAMVAMAAGLGDDHAMGHATGRHLGIDIGGTGMKAAPVDIGSGELAADRYRIPTPHPATPEAMASVVRDLTAHFEWSGPVGVAFPAVVRAGVVETAANIDDSWIGVHLEELLADATGCPVRVLNDADAAGHAEMAFGAGRGRTGTVVVTTLGTGIGSAVFADGTLVPNTEFGHLDIRGKPAEHRASANAREDKELSWHEWAERLQEFYRELEKLLWPELFIVGGGVSKKAEKFLPHLDLRTEIVPAELRNEAGIIGASAAAADMTT